MAMIPRKQDKAAAEGGASATKTAVPPAVPPAAAPTEAPTASTAVAAAPARAVSAVVNGKPRNAIEEIYKCKMQLEWNTLGRIQALQGNFLDLERNKTSFGNEIVVQLMSYQPSWQISPGTDDASDVEFVRYSDDGITTNKGEDCKEYVQALLASGRDKAKMSARYLCALVIEETPMDATGAMVGKIVQIDLSQSSKNSFDQFMLENGYKESRKMITPDMAESGRLRMKAVLRSQGNFTWTLAQFANA